MQRKLNQAGLDIAPTHWTVLACLWEQNTLAQKSLCDSTFIDNPRMTHIIDKLVELGYVKKQVCASDRRSNIISLTDKGMKLQMPVNYAVFELIKDSLANLSNKEIEMLRVILKKIFNTML
ncbi:MAG: MarR family transcriptional regulator [Prevotella sp.]|nr:MarR family transcriptional regulator [Prevotella sp.]